jgi:cell division septal protein FtsQ
VRTLQREALAQRLCARIAQAAAVQQQLAQRWRGLEHARQVARAARVDLRQTDRMAHGVTSGEHPTQ